MFSKILFHRMIAVLLSGLFLVACGSAQATHVPTLTPTVDIPMPTETPIPAPITGQLIVTDIPAPSLKDNMLGDAAEKSVVIYLPPSYEISDKRYPVVYFLPGYDTDNRAFTDGTFQDFRLQEAMDQLIAEGNIQEMIIAIPQGQHALGGSFYVNSPVTGNWEDFIVEDVVDYVDAQYRTIPSSKSRGIAGHSMGGYGALNLAMLHPDLFGAVYSLSPGLFDPDGLSNSQMFDSQEIIDLFLEFESDLAALSREEAHSTFLAEDIGAKDFRGNLLFTVNYGMAFSPNPDANAPYIDYTYHRTGDELVLDDEIWATWEAGFGGISEEVWKYQNNLSALEGLRVDYGGFDQYTWIPQGCEFFSDQLTEAGIDHDLVNFNGGHDNQVRDRIEQYMLPYFSDILVFE